MGQTKIENIKSIMGLGRNKLQLSLKESLLYLLRSFKHFIIPHENQSCESNWSRSTVQEDNF